MSNARSILVILSVVSILSFAAYVPGVGAYEVGIYGGKYFQYTWQPTILSEYDRCDKFWHAIDDYDHIYFYTDLSGGAKSWIEDTNDQSMTEKVDIVWISTHGIANTNYFKLAMYYQYTWASTWDMRLGDEQLGTSIWGNYACHSMDYPDNWFTPLKGGLRIVTGVEDHAYDAPGTKNIGERWADLMNLGYTIAWSWQYAFTNGYSVPEKVVIVTCGATQSDADFRVTHMRYRNSTFYKFTNFPRKRDGDCVKMGELRYTQLY